MGLAVATALEVDVANQHTTSVTHWMCSHPCVHGREPLLCSRVRQPVLIKVWGPYALLDIHVHHSTAWQHLHRMCQSSYIVGLQALAKLQQALWWWPSTRTHTYGATVYAEPRRAAALAAAATRAKKKRKEREDIATAHLVSPANYIDLYQSSNLPADATCLPAMHQQLLMRPSCAATKCRQCFMTLGSATLRAGSSCSMRSSQGPAAAPGCQSRWQGMRCL